MSPGTCPPDHAGQPHRHQPEHPRQPGVARRHEREWDGQQESRGGRTIDGRTIDDVAAEAGITKLLAYLRAARARPDAFRLLVTHAAHEPEFAEHARAVRERGPPDAERAPVVVPDPLRRRWAARTIGACVDASVLGRLDLTESEPDADDADMARRPARMLGAIAGAAR